MKINKGTDPTGREIVIVRDFDAPRTLVFNAFTDPKMVQQWMLGQPGHTMPVCEIDLQVGGTWRYVWRFPDGTEMGVGGSYRKIERAKRTVHTEQFDEDWTDGETIVTTEFADHEGGTRMTMTIRYASTAARDAAFDSPMAEGIEAGYQRLDAVLTAADET